MEVERRRAGEPLDHVGRVPPRHVVVVEHLERTRVEIDVIQLDDELHLEVQDRRRRDPIADDDAEVQLLLPLPGEGILRRLALLDLSAGKLPEPGPLPHAPPLPHQDTAILVDSHPGNHAHRSRCDLHALQPFARSLLLTHESPTCDRGHLMNPQIHKGNYAIIGIVLTDYDGNVDSTTAITMSATTSSPGQQVGLLATIPASGSGAGAPNVIKSVTFIFDTVVPIDHRAAAAAPGTPGAEQPLPHP